jgi:hypothetical protein
MVIGDVFEELPCHLPFQHPIIVCPSCLRISSPMFSPGVQAALRLPNVLPMLAHTQSGSEPRGFSEYIGCSCSMILCLEHVPGYLL